jgi:hypothetical protein
MAPDWLPPSTRPPAEGPRDDKTATGQGRPAPFSCGPLSIGERANKRNGASAAERLRPFGGYARGVRHGCDCELNAASGLFRGTPPTLSQVKLIAEPWDCGPGGYQVGHFSPGWAEWNDRFRDTVRSFWKGDEGKLADLATPLSASPDMFNKRGRKPWASVNFITAHDGFTLNDLVSYDDKHNDANGEDNRDGHSNNLSWNGIEGPTDDPSIKALRLGRCVTSWPRCYCRAVPP